MRLDVGPKHRPASALLPKACLLSNLKEVGMEALGDHAVCILLPKMKFTLNNKIVLLRTAMSLQKRRIFIFRD